MDRFFLIYQFIEEYTSNVAAWAGFFLAIIASMMLMSTYNRFKDIIREK